VSNEVSFDYSGTNVLVTGGTSGIGHAIASAFRDAGAEVTVTGTRPAASDYDTDLTGFGYRPLQLTDPASIDALLGDRGLEHLDVLVDNAGASLPGGRDEWEPEVFAEALALNLTGTMRLTVGCRQRLAASTMAGGASVVVLASMSAFRAVPIVPGYGSAKAGLVALARNLAVHWQGDGIRVNAVAPGLIDTPMTAPMAAFPEMLDEQLRRVPMGHMGTPADVAGAVLYLSSSAARYVTGSVLAVDGGYLAL
jgi:NAD(P)-dependent dehydrogenase (short-subunit alcohol dehydrogenase family)